jgi:hypothetical protein
MRRYASMLACLFIIFLFSAKASHQEHDAVIKAQTCGERVIFSSFAKSDPLSTSKVLSLPCKTVKLQANFNESSNPLSERVSSLAKLVLWQDHALQDIGQILPTGKGIENSTGSASCSYKFLRLNVLSSQSHPPTLSI